MNIEQNKNIRERWISSLFEIANFDYQRRLWIDAEFENEIGSYTECVCGYFNDLNLENGYTNFISDGIISKKDADIVAEMHSEFRSYTERNEKLNLSDNSILKDVEWKKFTQTALTTWNRLKSETESSTLRGLIIEQEKNYAEKM